MNLLWKLLRRHVSVSQLGGFLAANLIGMAILLLGVQFYQDILPVFRGNDSFFKKEYLIISKPVSTAGSLLGAQGTFSEKDINGLCKQPFTLSVGAFQSSLFNVSATIGMSGTGMRVGTEMFFESVPDAYVDITSDRWHYLPGSKSIPIIIPRNYLNLYNFGFAQSRKLPKLSEDVFSMIRLNVRLSGQGMSENYEGQIVGFSNRLNTILVPESFMNWANARYATGKHSRPSRLIVEVDNPADESIVHYFDAHRYEVEGDRLDTGKTVWFLRTIVGVVLGIGLMIILLSFYILMLSIYLLLQKNTTELQSLLLLGYSIRQVAWPYQALTILLNLVVLGLSIAGVWVFRLIYIEWLSALFPTWSGSGLWPMLGAGISLFILVSLLNIIIIHQKVSKIWKIK